MTDNEFLELAEQVFERIQTALDGSGLDLECMINEGVMEIEFDDDSKIIVNRHAPNQEIWVAARSGGFHFAYRDATWTNTRDGSDLFSSLGALISKGTGEDFHF